MNSGPVEIGTHSGCVNRLPLFADIMIRTLAPYALGGGTLGKEIRHQG